jgi:putative transposase
MGAVTYICIEGGWCYLAVVLDLYARRVVGFAVSESMTTKALQIACQTRLKPNDGLFHSDQGTHYTSKKSVESVADCDRMI